MRIHKIFSFEDAKLALNELKDRKTLGKVLLKIK